MTRAKTQIQETPNEKRNRLRREQRAEARAAREATQNEAAEKFHAALDTKDGEPVGATPLMLAAYDYERACAARDMADVAAVEAEEALERARSTAADAHTAVRGFRASLASAIGAVDKLAHEAIK